MKLHRSIAVALLVLASGMIAASGQTQTADVATNFQVTVGRDSSQNCTQTVGGSTNLYPKIDETKADTITWVAASPFNAVTINFPVGTAAFPGTPFFDDVAGQWVRQYVNTNANPTATPGATLPPQAGRLFRYPYALVTFNDGTHCSFPVGGMGVQVTR